MDAMRTLFKLSSRSDSHLGHKDDNILFHDNDQLYLDLNSEGNTTKWQSDDLSGAMEILLDDIITLGEHDHNLQDCFFVQVQEIDIDSLRDAHIKAIESIGKINLVKVK